MKLLILIIVMAWAIPAFAGFQEGTDAFERGDHERALKEFKALAEKNDPRGQYGMAIMHDLGEGVLQSSTQAAKWYQLAAEQGNADAQNNLGVMYENGEGVERDYQEALMWYRKAAESGNKDAPNNMGVMYMTGQGVLRDYIKAYMWFTIAGKADPEAAGNKKFLVRKMTSEEIGQGETLAIEWLQIRNHKKVDKN